MSTTARYTHLEKVLVEVTSILIERARLQLEREASSDDAAAAELRRVQELEQELRVIRHEFGLPPVPSGRQVSKFYEVPGQEDA